MSLDKHVLFAAACDGCGPDWWETAADTAPMFPSRTRALEELRDDYQWRITRRVDGSHEMFCPACATLEDCVRDGHKWVPLEYEFDGVVRCYGEVCRVCSVVRGDDVPAAGHPESMTVDLGDEIEEWLAVLDRELDPERANEEV